MIFTEGQRWYNDGLMSKLGVTDESRNETEIELTSSNKVYRYGHIELMKKFMWNCI